MAEWTYMDTLNVPMYPCVRRIIRHGNGRMELDGILEKETWENAPWTDAFVDIEGVARKPNPLLTTRVKMMWDDDYLYVGAVLQEPRVWGTLTEKNSIMYHENDFEIFIDPDGSHHNYYEFEINCLNTIWELVLHRPYKDGHSLENPYNLNDIHSAVHIIGIPNDPSVQCKQWSVEVAIPLKELVQFDERRSRLVQAGDSWRMNFSRVHYDLNIEKNNETGKDHYVKVPNQREYNYVWAPTGIIDIHRPEKWAFVYFLDLPTVDSLQWQQTQLTLQRELARENILTTAYYKQREYFDVHGVYAASLNSLYGENTPNGLTLETTENGKIYQFVYIDEAGKKHSINHESKYLKP
ncbi:hypothetical protein THRCLA_01747 [Thraustotheca clavata]|uniref:Carbohydrate-binding domain-containing protein n=1 Tax=Thraustotheca clavata TaxID=74557 RepID=A0A1W0A7E4_9STRA|nr:hypothetical protein THRCLA_01747 [Thraustotheca clavata]